MSNVIYAEKSWNPLSVSVNLTDGELRVGTRRMPLAELNLPAMADAYLRGGWLGGGGSERPLSAIPAGAGTVPVIRATGAAKPVRVRRAAEFVRVLGDLAVRLSGGRDAVAQAAERAAHEGVPLWMARRVAHGPAGPVVVAVDRRLVRADVWTPGLPVARLRGPYGMPAGLTDVPPALVVTLGEMPAHITLVQNWRKSKRTVIVQAAQGRWELWRHDARASRLLRDGRPVALLRRPAPTAGRGDVLLPLADVRHETGDPLDAVVAHFFAVVFGLGDATGTIRFGTRHRLPEPEEPRVWEEPWFTGLGRGGDDSGPGGGGDGWSDGGDGGGGDGGGSGGSDGGGGGGDGGGGGGGD
ncbi:hypothetical protein [Streptomyces specialis]|uniref:hypothetical protein n=1 Tax=Streptomyces specialis TaxID=498367 RepID=UPI00073E8797|nr:hypothetical protein [Streptomyces specialis]